MKKFTKKLKVVVLSAGLLISYAVSAQDEAARLTPKVTAAKAIVKAIDPWGDRLTSKADKRHMKAHLDDLDRTVLIPARSLLAKDTHCTEAEELLHCIISTLYDQLNRMRTVLAMDKASYAATIGKKMGVDLFFIREVASRLKTECSIETVFQDVNAKFDELITLLQSTQPALGQDLQNFKNTVLIPLSAKWAQKRAKTPDSEMYEILKIRYK